MKTAGQVLKEARLNKKVDIADVARVTKIRTKFLEFIEADDFRQLPSGTVARGFIRNYSEFVDLNPEYVLAIFRRDFVENQLGRIVPRGMADPVEKTSFWTPRSTVIAAVTAVFVLFAAYLGYQYRLLTGPPSLVLTRPTSLTVTDPNLEISGRTDPEASISVNGQLISLDQGGQFSFRYALHPGSNRITVTATAKSGRTATLTRTVVLR